jgi:hypothetical protein
MVSALSRSARADSITGVRICALSVNATLLWAKVGEHINRIIAVAEIMPIFFILHIVTLEIRHNMMKYRQNLRKKQIFPI